MPLQLLFNLVFSLRFSVRVPICVISIFIRFEGCFKDKAYVFYQILLPPIKSSIATFRRPITPHKGDTGFRFITPSANLILTSGIDEVSRGSILAFIKHYAHLVCFKILLCFTSLIFSILFRNLSNLCFGNLDAVLQIRRIHNLSVILKRAYLVLTAIVYVVSVLADSGGSRSLSVVLESSLVERGGW